MRASDPLVRGIADVQTLEDALGSHRAVLLKHSTTCSISTVALDELMRFAGTHPEWEIYVLKVLEARDLSDTLSQRLGVHHESPQVFVVKDGCAVWHGSHFDITARRLTEHAC